MIGSRTINLKILNKLRGNLRAFYVLELKFLILQVFLGFDCVLAVIVSKVRNESSNM